ncbi:hypothetical protein D3C80_1593630 [compost metagenome]
MRRKLHLHHRIRWKIERQRQLGQHSLAATCNNRGWRTVDVTNIFQATVAQLKPVDIDEIAGNNGFLRGKSAFRCG